MAHPKLRINQGELEGREALSPNGVNYYYFKGIPYAKPPVGDLRFKDPLPPLSWEGVRDASAEGNICPQIRFDTHELAGDEDCLYLNVFTTSLNPEKKLPVMFWIHGGAYLHGSGSNNPLYMIEKDVVLVFINYRLSVLGFLCADDPEFPGNAGLKDQVMALRWVRQNIEKFGGNPDNVTIMGGSAGGSSVHYLTLSPMAKGLVHKAIIQSGSALCPWALRYDPVNDLKKLAASLGNNTENAKEAAKFLQTINANVLIPAAIKVLNDEDYHRHVPSAFLPVVETKYPNVEGFMTVHPEEVVTNGQYQDIPIIAGCSTYESIFMFDRIEFNPERCAEMVKDLRYFIPKVLNIPFDSPESHKIAEEMKELYFGQQEINVKSSESAVHLISDCLFKHGTDRLVRIMTKNSESPVYYYEFSHVGNHSRLKSIAEKMNVKKAAHSEENCYLFSYKDFADIPPTPEDVETRDRLIKMWTDFAKFGNPTPKTDELITTIWKPATSESINYLDIGHNLTNGTDPYYNTLKFWNNLYHKYKSNSKL